MTQKVVLAGLEVYMAGARPCAALLRLLWKMCEALSLCLRNFPWSIVADIQDSSLFNFTMMCKEMPVLSPIHAATAQRQCCRSPPDSAQDPLPEAGGRHAVRRGGQRSRRFVWLSEVGCALPSAAWANRAAPNRGIVVKVSVASQHLAQLAADML